MERFTQLKDFLVQLDVLHTGSTPFVLQSLELVHELGTAVFHAVHVTHQGCLVGLQLDHLCTMAVRDSSKFAA